MSTKDDLIKSLREKKARIAILGLGIMGGGMARQLLAAGFDLTMWNRSAGRPRRCATGRGFAEVWRLELVSSHVTATKLEYVNQACTKQMWERACPR